MTILVSLSLDQIESGKRLRSADNDYVEFLAASMAERGLTNPITVGKKKSNGNYPLLAGMHRLQAAKLLNWASIFVIVDPVEDELQQQLIEIDENLCRHELSQLDRSTFLARRQEIYEVINPETKAGVAGANAANGNANAKFAFADEVAEKIGISKRTIQLSIQRFNNICPKVREKISDTWIANKGTELDALMKLTAKEQMNCVNALLRVKDPAKNTKAALAEIRGEATEDTRTTDEKDLDALKLKFVKASGPVRDQFLAYIKELELV